MYERWRRLELLRLWRLERHWRSDRRRLELRRGNSWRLELLRLWRLELRRRSDRRRLELVRRWLERRRCLRAVKGRSGNVARTKGALPRAAVVR